MDAISNVKNRDIISGSTPPSIIVGEKGYPKVNIIFNLPPNIYGDSAKEYENPQGWWGRKSLGDIIKLRSYMVSSIIKNINVNDPLTLYNNEIALAGISQSSVTSEVKIEKILDLKLKFDGIITPIGPLSLAEYIKIEDNPKISKIFDKIIFDDVKATEAVKELYQKNENYYTIINAFSLGLLGFKKNRKIVPTRWAISAVDNIVGEMLYKKVKNFKEIEKINLFLSGYLGNNFFILLYPSKINFIWIEIWHPNSLWSNEVVVTELEEDYKGNYEYFDGGFMAARVGVLEYLSRISRQAGCIVVREITSSYYAPVGNWHIRETVRNAFLTNPIHFDKLSDAIAYIQNSINIKINLYQLKSIKRILYQKQITDYLS